MLREKLITTLVWTAICVAGAMLADYLITIVLLNDIAGYTPAITASIATLIALPTTYALVSGRLELRKARDALAVARDAAIEASNTRTQFFSNMTHELRTPLNAIIGFSDLIALDVFAARRVEYAQLINSSGKHLLSLVNDLLDLSRIEAGKIELNCEPIALDALIAECCGLVAQRVRERQQVLRTEIAPDLPLLDADRRALKQILLNLLTNAVKFGHPGGAIDVTAARSPDGGFVLAVTDAGIGIAEGDLDKVFERFGQVGHDIAGVEKGTGLGLPIVRGLTEAHGGHVRLESAVGRGSTFTVWFPPDRCLQKIGVALAS
ncbi:MAG: HAMP domain-containing histidine kinase [Proteobacteria bacterium]|nr:HAMP domain-containing histidine kinase [Pseudomonadota bacterium]